MIKQLNTFLTLVTASIPFALESDSHQGKGFCHDTYFFLTQIQFFGISLLTDALNHHHHYTELCDFLQLA